jgi:hypothetical protein
VKTTDIKPHSRQCPFCFKSYLIDLVPPTEGWALKYKGAKAPIRWSVCDTRAEARELRDKGLSSDPREIEIVKVRLTVELVPYPPRLQSSLSMTKNEALNSKLNEITSGVEALHYSLGDKLFDLKMRRTDIDSIALDLKTLSAALTKTSDELKDAIRTPPTEEPS